MKQYKVIKTGLTLASGRVCITDHQAGLRSHNLKPVEDGFEIVNPICFKVGETFWYDGNVKGFMDLLEDITPAFEPVSVPSEMEQSIDLNLQAVPEPEVVVTEPVEQEVVEPVKKKK